MKKYINLVILVFILVLNHDVYGKTLQFPYFSRVTWGLGAGAVVETGNLKNELNPGFNLNLLIWWPLPVNNLFVVNNLGLDYFTLSESHHSRMYSLYIEAGLGYRVKVNKYFQPYGGILLHGAYFHVDTQNLGEEEHSVKPGLALEAGIFCELSQGFGLKAGLKGKFEPVSNELYSPLTIEIAATFRYASMQEDRINSNGAGSLSFKLQRVRRDLRARKIKEAEKRLKRIIGTHPDNEDALSLQNEIGTIHDHYKKGTGLYRKGLFIEALPFLDKSSPYYTDALNKSNAVRKRYGNQIPSWERRGVTAYEKQNYDTCITIMRKILLIDPRNRVAGIYLPRAVKRKQALESLH